MRLIHIKTKCMSVRERRCDILGKLCFKNIMRQIARHEPSLFNSCTLARSKHYTSFIDGPLSFSECDASYSTPFTPQIIIPVSMQRSVLPQII